jgi:lipoprotein-anchoring transpeptidase ErfK/SrfK
MATTATAALLGAHPRTTAARESAVRRQAPQRAPWVLYGRAIHTVHVYAAPTTAAERVASYRRDERLRLLGELRSPYSAHNNIWYRTPEGYVHSAWILPVRIYPSQPFHDAPSAWGFWGEIAQLHTEARTAPRSNARRQYRFYGGTVFRVIDVQEDDEGNGWYKVKDDYPPGQVGNHQWVLAEDVRRIPESEMTPIHPFVGDKRVEVDLSQQTLSCWEGPHRVFSTPMASGLGGELATPTGEFSVILKQPSRHMSNVVYEDMPEEDRPNPGDIFDLPGVPWNIFFDLEGRAIHGTYWHNDFGLRRSHGCLNVPIHAARWIYRWVQPIAGYEDDFVQSDGRVGTPILIR